MTQPAQPQQSSEEQVQAALAAQQQNNSQQTQTDPTQQSTQQQQPPVVTSQESQAPYANYLAELPETVRPLAEQAFKKWDADVTRRFQELHSQYDPYKPIIEAGDPDSIQGALQVAQVLEADPARFLTAFAEAYPELVQQALGQQQQQQAPQGQQTSEQGLGDLDPNDPLVQRISQLETMLNQAVQGFTGVTEQQQQKEQQEFLDKTLADLHTKHGDFDDVYVLSQMAYRGLDPEKAVTEFQNNIVAKYGQQQTQQQQQVQNGNGQQAPAVLPPGGGLPSEPVDVNQLAGDDKATQALVTSLLEAAHQQQQ